MNLKKQVANANNEKIYAFRLWSFMIINRYQEAFAISPEFATTHHRLSSIRGYNTKEGGLCVSQNSDSENS